MATVADIVPETEKLQCKLCGLQYAPSAGRQHGRVFRCAVCDSAERTVRRNLGEESPLNEWEKSDCEQFFQRLRKEKEKDPQGKLLWQTVRANMVTTLCEKAMSRFESTCEVSALPLSVYLKKGWTKEVIEAQPSEYSEQYGCEVFKVPVQKLKWQETFERERAKILRKEQECAQRKKNRKAKGQDDDDDMDVPYQASAKESDKKSNKEEKDAEKKAAREEKKMLQNNEKVAALATKSVGPLTAAASTVAKVLEKAEDHRAVIDPGVMTTAQEILDKLEPWSVAAREALNRHDANKKSPAESCLPIAALPFAADDVKTVLKQNTETVKALRAALPKRAPRPKAEAAPGKENTSATANAAEADDADGPKLKRRRVKSQP